ncbi:MAG TPA: hypothetical protein VG322_15145 [Candidatus Acidoferrales bacterium]|nr:hypothetical protein [Candidatus Acidoferrales bacterium]
MIRNAEDLSPAQKAAIESLVGREVTKGEVIGVRVMPPVPEWLQNAWQGAKERGIDRLSSDDIQEEIDAYRSEKRQVSSEDSR